MTALQVTVTTAEEAKAAVAAGVRTIFAAGNVGGFPNLNDATDVFIHPSIPATAALNGDTDTLNSPDDAGDDAASEHTA